MKQRFISPKTMVLIFVLFLILPQGNHLGGQSKATAAPTASTSAASGIGPNDATLNGLVNPNNESTTIIFEYSTNANFYEAETPPPDTITADQSPLSGSGFQAVSANITGLTPGTVYYFRVAATNGSGTSYGDVLSFSTSPPATVTTGIASPVTTTTAQLNGIVNANNNSTTVTFEYGLTTAYGSTVTADQSPVTGSTDTAVSKLVSGLTPNTTYHFRVVGDNALGVSYGEDNTFFTSAQAAPTVTTDEATFSIFPNQATLNGIVNANNSDATVTFEYGTTTAYGNTITADQSPVLGSTDTNVSKLITGLVADTTYHYRVVATNSQDSTNGADMTFFNTIAPYARTDNASNITQNGATLNGTVNPKTIVENSTTVTFEYGETASYGTTVTAIESPTSGQANQGVSIQISGLSPNTTYHFRVIADNANGTGTGDDVTFTTSSLPIVTTGSASPVGTNSATLNGTVNPNNDSTTVTFEYGMTTSYGTTVTADQSPLTGTADTAVSRAISGLANATTYHYRVVGTNSSGTVNGEDMTFTTGVTPPTVSTGAASGITTTSATMNGTVNANGLSTNVAFEWGLTTSYGQTNAAIPSTVTGTGNTAVSFTPTTLLPNTTYHYRVKAQNAGGVIYGADISFTTNATPTVTTNPATSTTTTGTTLNGIVNANNQSSAVTFEYGLTTAYGTTVTADQSPVTGSTDTAVSKAITGLTPNTTYHYRVVGTNASGTSYGADMTFSTSVGPPTVTTGSASPLVTGAVINGIVNANNASTIVTFEYGTTVAYGSTVTADQSPVTGSSDTAVSVTLSGLTFNTTYHYRVLGTNVNGATNGADMTFTTSLNPSATTGTATNVLGTSATLNGTANGNGGVWSIRFDYGTTVAYGSTIVATPSQTSGSSDIPVSAIVTSLTPNTTYHFRTTVYSGGFTYPGLDETFTTLSGPSATTNAATSVLSQSATLNGTVNANNLSTTVTFEYGFDTSYGQTSTAIQSPVTGNTNTAVSFDLSALIPNSTYHFRVVASNANGTVYGGDLTFSTTAIPPTVTTTTATGIGATGATLNGEVNPNNDSTTVTFEYGTSTAYGTTVTADQSPLTGSNNATVSKGITGLTANTTYHYRVVGQNGAGLNNGLDMTFTTGSNTPTVSTGTASGISTTGATLNGTVNANGASTTVTFEYGTTTSYGKTITADQSPLTGTTDTAVSAAISGLIPGTTYHYRLVGQNAFGAVNGSDMTFLTAGTAPDATTDAATSVGATTATLNGTVNANNDSTSVTFEYGTTAAYGSTMTAVPDTVSGNTDTAVSAALTGLTANTAYHYRVVGQNAFGTSNGADMTFTTGAITLPVVTTTAISNISTSSASSGGNVTDEGGGTVTVRGVCWSTSANPTLADSKTANGSGLGAFSSAITGLSENTTYYVRAYATNSTGTSYGQQRSFTTNAETVTVEITNPADGEQVSGTVTIEAATTSKARAGGTVQAVNKVEFYIDDIIIGTVNTAPYEIDWDTTTATDGTHTIKAIAYNAANESSQDEISVTVINSPAEISLNRDKMNFGSDGSLVTSAQTLLINNSGGNTLVWSISDDASWLSASPASGTGNGVVSVSVDPGGLPQGTYTATLTVTGGTTVSDGGAATVAVTLIVYGSGSTSVPFGTFSTPLDGSTVRSSIPVTGWVLDEIETTSVKIYRSPVAGDTLDAGGLVYIGDAVFVDGARPDIEALYPDMPLNYQAGWGYMLLTNGLPGDGGYTLYAKATDAEGNTVTLGSKTIYVDNASAIKPFGAIDTPVQGGVASGDDFVNFGWALTPQPNTIPTDGSTIKVWVDGVPLPGNPIYNQYRQDIADMFPGYNNSNGAVGYMYIDTTAYLNGVHTIAWSVKDNAGNTDGVGSRYFSVINVGSSSRQSSATGFGSPARETSGIKGSYNAPLSIRRGFDDGLFRSSSVKGEALTLVTIKELEPLAIDFGSGISGIRGYMVYGNRLTPLPVGSTLDVVSKTFSWLPGAGFVGSYRLIFIIENPDGQKLIKEFEINILPKFPIHKDKQIDNKILSD